MPPKIAFAIGIGVISSIGFAVATVRRWRSMSVAAHWPSVPGKIIESVEFKDHENRTHFRIRYEFTMGERMEGSSPRLSGDWFWSNRSQTSFVARFAEGQAIEVYYDPRNPKRNCIDRDDSTGLSAMAVLAVGSATVTWILWMLHR